MELHHPAAEAFASPVEQLGNQSNLRGEQQGALPRIKSPGGRLQINLGLAGACDPAEQKFLAGRGSG